MKKLCTLMMITLAAAAARAVVIDDFQDGDLSDYTYTVILDTGGNPHNESAWQITDGQLQLNTTAYSDIEQSAFVKAGYTLNVGEEIRTEYVYNGGSRAMGLYVGVVPTDSVRQNYITVYGESSTNVLSRGFDGTSEMTLLTGSGNYTKLFIARDGVNDYETGYYVGDTRTVVADRNGLAFGAGDTLVVGFYTDVRNSGVLGDADNLEIISIPMPPTIVSHPNDLTISQSQDASFETVFTSPSAPSVNWYKVALPDDLFLDPAGVNIDVQLTYDAQTEQYTSTLSLTNLSIADSGQYYCQIVNNTTSVSSNPADLTVYGLVAHWTLNQDRYADSNYLEEVAGYHAVVNGTPTFVPGADGIANHAVQITAADGWALCPVLDPIKQSGQLTLSFWANWSETPGTEQDLLAESPLSNVLVMPNGLKADGNWQHVCTVYDGTTGKLYVDGVLRDQGSWPLPADTEAAINIGISSDQQNPFNGAMDDVRIFNYALTDTQVADLRYALSGERSCILMFDATYDLVPDCVINIDDLVAFANQWLNSYDLSAFADLASSWQSSGLYPAGN